MKVLLTGAAGYLGTAAARALLDAGHDVRATDIRLRRNPPVKIEPADLLNMLDVYRLIDGVEAVVHLGNHPNAYACEPRRLLPENVTMNFNVFEAARQVGVKKVVFASSIQVISGNRAEVHAGKPSELPYFPLDGNVPPNPGNHYAVSKQLSEIMLRYQVTQGLPSGVAIRFPHITRSDHPRFASGPMLAWAEHPHSQYNLDEAFTHLPMNQATDLILAILRADLPGYRTYFPAVMGFRLERPLPQIIAQYFPNVPLRQPVEQLTSLVDVSAITRDTGWQPTLPTLTEAVPPALTVKR